MYANRHHANRPSVATKADRIRMAQPWKKEPRRIALALVLKIAAAIVAITVLADLALTAAQPDTYAGTFRAVRVVYGMDYVIDYGMGGQDCAERIAALADAHCEAE